MIRQFDDFLYFCLLQPMVNVVIYEPKISVLHCDSNIGYKHTTTFITCGNWTHDHMVKATRSTDQAKKAPQEITRIYYTTLIILTNVIYYLNYVYKYYLLSFLGWQPKSNRTKQNTQGGYLLSVQQHCLYHNNTIAIDVCGNNNQIKWLY